MLADPGTARVRRTTAAFVSTLILTACGESLAGPVERDTVPPTLSTAPVLVRTTACQGGSAGGFPCNGVDLVARMTASALRPGRAATHVNDVWGWTDPQTGVEYALVGRDDGLSIVDLSTPHAPRPIAFLPSHTGSSIWRDMKVYADHVYVVADNIAGHGMQILDLTRLRGLAAFTELSADARYTRVSAVHNLAINEETGFAYALGSSRGGDTCGGGLHMINLSNPTSPSFAGCHAVPGTGRQGRGYTHDVQCVVYRGPDGAYAGREICVGTNETAIVVSDVSDKANPRVLSTGGYADYGYVHQGWLSEDHRYFYQNDELDELNGRVSRTRLLVWDLADLDDPVLVTEHLGPTGAIDHNLYVRGNFIYHSNYAFGVRILDISNPATPVERGFFDTVAGHDNNTWDGSWSIFPWFESGILVATSWDEGLFVLRLQP
ncbi:choice-of-anchor B family protein [Candidatus Palauibacter sp.]|uniref:choice-of-anchor B family protein n=1 Tax=Candidatus Palauibacter sp. TaxID=3101350 RepID=UPI003B519F12